MLSGRLRGHARPTQTRSCYADDVTQARARVPFDEVYARYRELPEGTEAEIVAGEIRVLPRPRPRHVRAATRLSSRLGRAFDWDVGDDDGPGGWVLLAEPELRLGDDVRAPDLAGWREERYVEADDNPITLVPDWICEVLSPSTARSDRAEKMPLYAQHGVHHLWIVDPAMKTLEVYRREDSTWIVASTHGDDDKIRAVPFDAVELDLGALWRLPNPG